MLNPDNRPPHLLYMDGNRSYPAAIRDLEAEGRQVRAVGDELNALAIIGLNPITGK